MADGTSNSGLRYPRVAAWGPPIIMVLGLVFLAISELTVGFLLVGAAVVFWVVVRRKKGQATGEGAYTP